MILLLVLAVAFVISLLLGGRPSRLLALPLRWPLLPILAFAAQAVIVYFPEARHTGWGSVHVYILLLSYLALLVMVWMNRRLPGMALLGLGLLLNLVVILANGGYMPIAPETRRATGFHDSRIRHSGCQGFS